MLTWQPSLKVEFFNLLREALCIILCSSKKQSSKYAVALARVATAIGKLNFRTFQAILGHFPELFKTISTYVSVIGIACIIQ